MHVLYIVSGPMVVPAEPYANIFQYEQAKAMANDGHQVGVISTGFITLRHLFRNYSYQKIEKYGKLNILRRYKRSIKFERFSSIDSLAARHIELFSDVYSSYKNLFGLPDVIYAHNFLFSGIMAHYALVKDGVPYGLTEHSSAFMREMIPKSFDISLVNVAFNAKFLTCVSSRLKFILENRLGYIFEVLPNIVDKRFLDVCLSRKLVNEKFVFIAIGTLDSNKNHSMLIKAFASHFKGKLVYLKIIGSGPLLKQLKILVYSLGVSEQVLFMGALSRDNVCEELMQSNCLVSTSNNETFGVAIIEAIACGLPVISTRSGGPDDIVNENNGILIDVGSEQQLCKAMIYIISNYYRYVPLLLRSEAKSKYGYLSFKEKLLPLLNLAFEE